LSSFEITHLEYHPVGSELSAVRCRALAVSRDGDYALLEGTDTPISVDYAEYSRAAGEWYEIPTSISADANFEVLAFGPTLVSALSSMRVLDTDPMLRMVEMLDVHAFGVRLFAGAREECDFLTSRISEAVMEAFDTECRKGRDDSPLLLLLWRIIARDPAVSTEARIARGVFLFTSRAEKAALDAILLDAEIADGIGRGASLLLADRYRASVWPSKRPNHSDDFLALNAKLDLMGVKVDRLEDRVASGQLAPAPAVGYQWLYEHWSMRRFMTSVVSTQHIVPWAVANENFRLRIDGELHELDTIKGEVSE